MTDPAPLDPAVQEILRQSPIGPLLGKPVDQVLASIGAGLPQFPPLPPIPGFPPLPAIDPAVLLKPITDMLGQFGTGQLGGMGAVNPQQILSQVVNGLTQVISLGSSAIGLLAGLQGKGTDAAASKSTQAQGNASELVTQAGQIKAIVTAAATVVQLGNAALAAIAAKLVATTAALAAVPGAQAAIAAAAAEAAAESAAVVAKVRAELTALSTQMTTAGRPVPVTKPPNVAGAAGKDGQQLLQQVQQLITPLTQLVQQGSKVADQAVRPAGRPVSAPAAAPEDATGRVSPAVPLGAGLSGRTGGSVAASSAATSSAAALRPFQHTPIRVAASEIVRPTGSVDYAAAGTVGGRGEVTPMMPPVAGPLARAGDAGTGQTQTPVVGIHYDEVDSEGVATPVVGVVDELDEPPDQRLVL
ncbi:hypothetical protein [Nocardia sp. NPDC052566]|uniref:hypothetical protein n=1 Tax=Nocardia sp. NPDC052566 TaxID=3364330 RepID=UPI0037C66A66